MRWWPAAAATSATVFVISLAGFFVSPSIAAFCAQIGGSCDEFNGIARSLVVGSGSFLAASLVAGLYTGFLVRSMARRGGDKDTRPLVSVHARRRH